MHVDISSATKKQSNRHYGLSSMSNVLCIDFDFSKIPRSNISVHPDFRSSRNTNIMLP